MVGACKGSQPRDLSNGSCTDMQLMPNIEKGEEPFEAYGTDYSFTSTEEILPTARHEIISNHGTEKNEAIAKRAGSLVTEIFVRQQNIFNQTTKQTKISITDIVLVSLIEILLSHLQHWKSFP